MAPSGPGSRNPGHTQGMVSELTVSELALLQAGQPIIFGGNQVTQVSKELADEFVAGDRLVVVDETGALLHIRAEDAQSAALAVSRAERAFAQMGATSDAAISTFFEAFAQNLADDQTFAPILEANAADVTAATERGRSTTRLVLSDQMRADMIAGLRGWAQARSRRDEIVERIDHDGWRIEQRVAGLGVVGFVFEGRPNVFADACGVLRSGNTVAFRIGSDALRTARAIVRHALDPALAASGLPEGCAVLVDNAARAAGWALFSDKRLALAVARGSGAAVSQLGAVASQAGIPVSLHGTGGAWIVASENADPQRMEQVVAASLDRKVCNTLNTCVVVAAGATELVPRVLAGLSRAAEQSGVNPKLHVTASAEEFIPADWFSQQVPIVRAEGETTEAKAEMIHDGQLGHEWEWEASPEITLAVMASIADAVAAFNSQSPRFAASLISEVEAEQDEFWATVDAPFVGDGFTRWVDGQYALDRPELGLSNWQFGRLFARGGVLAGDSVFTIRSRVYQSDPSLKR